MFLGTVISALWGPKGAKLCSAFPFSSVGHCGIHWCVSPAVTWLVLPSVSEHGWPEPGETLVGEMVPMVTVVTTIQANTRGLSGLPALALSAGSAHWGCPHLGAAGNCSHKEICPKGNRKRVGGQVMMSSTGNHQMWAVLTRQVRLVRRWSWGEMGLLGFFESQKGEFSFHSPCWLSPPYLMQ